MGSGEGKHLFFHKIYGEAALNPRPDNSVRHLRTNALRCQTKIVSSLKSSSNSGEIANNLSRACWQHLGIQWNFASDFFQMLIQAKQQFTNPYFMEIFIIAAWQIWKQRNNFIFDRGRP